VLRKGGEGVDSMRKIIIKLSSPASRDPTAVVASSTSPARPIQVESCSDVIPSSIVRIPVPSLGVYLYSTQMTNHSHIHTII